MTRRQFFNLLSRYLAGIALSCFTVSARAGSLRASNDQVPDDGPDDGPDNGHVSGHDSGVESIAFGSCNHTHLQQPMWTHIESHRPDLFLWLGDVVYADTDDPVEMARQFTVQHTHPEYQKVRRNMPVLGIWDDHDYGGNNLGRDNPIKIQGQQLFLDFLGEPADSVRRRQQGIYTSYTYGSGEHEVKMYLLDTRYHRDRGGIGRASLLGEDQWRWLETELHQSTARVNIIASGSSVLSTQIPGGEEWADFRWDKKKLFHLINKHQVEGVLFLAGDRHFAALLSERVSGKKYYEFMCSGLTHYLTRPKAKLLVEFFLGKSNCYFGTNFGLLNFTWPGPIRDEQTRDDSISARFEVYDKDNQKRMDKQFHLQDGHWVLS